MAPPKPKNTSGMSNDPMHDAADRRQGADPGSPFGGLGPPPPAPGKKNKEQQFYAWAKKNGIGPRVAKDVWFWGKKYGLDAYYWGAVLLVESGARHKKGGSVVSSGQADGIGQIAKSWVGQPIPWDTSHAFTADDNQFTGIDNYAVNIRFSGYLLKQGVNHAGYDGAYTDPNFGYNRSDPNKNKALARINTILKSRPSGLPALAPTGGDAPATPPGTGPNPPPFKDPYVAGVDKHGKFSTTLDPNKAMQYNGQPLTRSSFLSLRDQLTSWYISYTGQRPSNNQIQAYVDHGWNPYTLTAILSQSKAFTKSPIYKQFSANYQAALKDLLPNGASIPLDLIRQGILNHWDSNTLAAKLRKLPTYVKSNEFRNNFATLANVHSSIMGTPDANGLISIRDASLAGWSQDQYAAYLRSQPAYSGSPEYQSKALGFLSSLGLITGARPVLSADAAVGPGPGGVQPKTQGAIPSDPRVNGDPNQLKGPLAGLGVTLK